MKIAVRVDASNEIGTGHVMRCLTLANMLKVRGDKIHFICRPQPGHMADQIKANGHGSTLLPMYVEVSPVNDDENPLKHASWLGANWRKDADQTIQVLRNLKPDWLVVDHYAIDAKWERKVKVATGVKIMAIDGMADRVHDCDMLLDQTYSTEGESRWKNFLPIDCKLFVGPQYALLRREFIEARQTMRERDGSIKRILIAFGGVDQPNATGAALAAVIALNRPDIVVDVVVGAGNPHRAMLEGVCRGLTNVTLHVQSSNMALLMSAADLSIGGGGTMMWERAFMDLPSVVIAIAKNQIGDSIIGNEIGLHRYLGMLHDVTIEQITDCVRFYLTNPAAIIALGQKCSSLRVACDLPLMIGSIL